MTAFTIVPDGAFSLEAAAGFGFGPNSGRPSYGDAGMKLAFATDDFEHSASVALDQHADGVIHGRLESDADEDAVIRQVKRILSLDASGTDWEKVGRSDEVVGRLQSAFPGLRPVLFHSPYEAAAWSIISARRHRAQATVVRSRLSAALGTTYGEGSDAMYAFPTPARLLELRELQGLDPLKIERLHAVARAAIAGELDPAHLLAMPADEALESIQRLKGFGPMYSTLVLLRSTGATDIMTGFEPRLFAYLTEFYGLASLATPGDVLRIAEGWRPFRTWTGVLVRVAGERSGIPVPDSQPGVRSRA